MPYFVKGFHFSFFPKLKIHLNPEWLSWDIMMPRAHDVGDKVEQWDWMKICGVAWSLNARKISTMLGGRWNTEDEVWEFTPYTHREGESKPVYGQPFFTAEKGEEFQVFLKVDHKEKKYTWKVISDTNETLAEKSVDFYHNRKIARQVSPWAGGTLPSPQTYYFKSKSRPV